MRSKYPFLDYAGNYWGQHARGPPEHVLGIIIFLFLGRELRGLLACDLIDDSAGYWTDASLDNPSPFWLGASC